MCHVLYPTYHIMCHVLYPSNHIMYHVHCLYRYVILPPYSTHALFHSYLALCATKLAQRLQSPSTPATPAFSHLTSSSSHHTTDSSHLQFRTYRSTALRSISRAIACDPTCIAYLIQYVDIICALVEPPHTSHHHHHTISLH